MTEHGEDPAIRPEAVQALFSAWTDLDPAKLTPLVETAITNARRAQAGREPVHGEHRSQASSAGANTGSNAATDR